MRRRLLLFGLCALVSASAVSAQENVYRDYILGYTFQPPTGWKLTEIKNRVGQVSLLQPLSRSLILVTVEAQPGQVDDGKPATTAQLSQLSATFSRRLGRSQLGKVYGNFKPLFNLPSRIGTFNSAELFFRGIPRKSQTAEGRVIVCIGSDKNRLVTITMIAPSTDFDSLQPSLLQVLRSFQLSE
ncbi:MAG: hypothetical protein H7Y37_14180 [Anaerolineae bacterium]|nr:hypothetical protein [Gloeobacterales cyanobacterium ES-bin-313]